MRSTLELFFTLIQISLSRQNIPNFSPSGKEWEALFALAKKQTLVGVLYEGIQCLNEKQLPPKNLLFNWYMMVETIKKNNMLYNRRAVDLQQHFLHDGFRNVVMKGQGIATLYTHPILRICGDIDFLFEGNRKSIIAFIKLLCPTERIVYHNISYSASKDIPVEIHFTPSWMFSYFTNKRLQRFSASFPSLYENMVKLPEDTGELFVPPLAFNRVFILVHIYRHLFGEGIGLRQVMDYYHVLHQGFTEDERKDTLRTLKELKMLRFTQGIMYILKTVFALEEQYLLIEPDDKHGKFLLSEIIRAGNFGHYDKTITTTAKDSMLALFYKRTKRNLRFLSYYPSEVIWCPLFKIWHFCWRKYHGWI